MHIMTIEKKSLGDRSYLVHDGAVALVIDPQRDGNLLFGSVGRTDLVGPAITTKLAHAQYHSASLRALAGGDGR
jgi:hydroxyacylglutathione hydrolase